MFWHNGDMIKLFYSIKADAIGFTANSCVTKDRKLVMGKGSAKTIRDNFPDVDRILGEKIYSNDLYVQKDYYVKSTEYSNFYIMAIQTKRHFIDNKMNGELELYTLTSKSLEKLSSMSMKHPERIIVMNCPLIGCASFKIEDVKQLVEDKLKDCNIYVCIKE